MARANVSLNTIEDFLAQKRIAMIGVSRQAKDFSLDLFDEFCKRGYDMVPVNPNTMEVRGRHSFARVQDVQPPVDAALLMTSPTVTEQVIKECAQAGIKRVWMYRAAGTGAVSQQALEFCKEEGIEVVPGQCPFMFFPNNGAHGLHGLVRKILGTFPKRTVS